MRRLLKPIFGSTISRAVLVLTYIALLSGCVYVYILPPAKITQHLENFVVMETAKTDFGVNVVRSMSICKEFYRHYEDEFDLLVLMAHNPSGKLNLWGDGTVGKIKVVRSSDSGTGVTTRDLGRVFGSGHRLKGIVSLTHPDHIFDGVLLHEIMHLWMSDIEVIPSAYDGHWGFSSVGGQLGGFQLENLKSLGNGKYSAGNFVPQRALASIPYSPLELYLAGWLPPSEVPDVWVAEDGSWLKSKPTDGRRDFERDLHGNRIFTASKISTWSIEQIIERLGPRLPDFEHSQKEFRIAFVLVTDGQEPISEEELGLLHLFIFAMTKKGPVSDWLKGIFEIEHLYNFWHATRGVASLDQEDLQSFRR